MAAHPEQDAANLTAFVEGIPLWPFDKDVATAYGSIRFATRDSKKDHLYKLIAAHAVAVGSALVTNNLKRFAKYPGLQAENWLTPVTNH